jgi:hypothetical protein
VGSDYGRLPGSKIGDSGRIFREWRQLMATIVRCNCDAEYKRTETKFLLPHTGGEVSGAALEAWWESTHVPSFELVKTSRQKADMTDHPKRHLPAGLGQA